VRLAGLGQGTGPLSLRERDVFTSFPATRIAAARAYQMAETLPQGIDFAEIHDAFTPFEILTTEDLGFFPPGKGGEAAVEGKTAIEGSLPINPSGGLKARGHPVGASGLAQIVEATTRLRRQSQSGHEFRRGLTQSTGGLGTNNFVTILERADSRPIQSPGLSLPSAPLATARKKAASPAAISDEGVIETFTIVYVTPDGFLPPLALALIRERHGHLLMAQGEDIVNLKIGREVYLRRIDDFFVFTVKSHFKKVQESLKRFLGRGGAFSSENESSIDNKP
jgi:acetyl-CoA C-acetyltransferase